MSKASLIPAERIERRILLLRGQKAMLDFQLAELYEVETKALNQAVKRNLERFPKDFMFQLTEEESDVILRSQSVTSTIEDGSNPLKNSEVLRSQIVTSNPGQVPADVATVLWPSPSRVWPCFPASSEVHARYRSISPS